MIVTTETLDAKADNQVRRLRPWLADARKMIESKVADARAHAGNTITETLRDTPDGRRTIVHAKQSRSYQSALSRLNELADMLALGIGDFRETSYTEAFQWWSKATPDEWKKSADPKPRTVDLAWVRTMPLHGVLLGSELATAVDDAGRRLLATISQAGSSGLTAKAGLDLMRGWEARTVNAMFSTVSHLLSDSQIMIDRKAARDVCKPEILHPDPSFP